VTQDERDLAMIMRRYTAAADAVRAWQTERGLLPVIGVVDRPPLSQAEVQEFLQLLLEERDAHEAFQAAWRSFVESRQAP
jgi:hypothetical protein